MKVIKLWYYRVTRCEYTSDRRTGEPRLNVWWGSDDESYTYSGTDALKILEDYAEDYRQSWSKYGERIQYPTEVGYAICVLVPIKDGADLPTDPEDLARECSDYDTRYLALEDTDIAFEHDLPQYGRYSVLWEDGLVFRSDSMGSDGDRIDLLRPSESSNVGNDEIFDPHNYLPRWKAAGWDGEVTEV